MYLGNTLEQTLEQRSICYEVSLSWNNPCVQIPSKQSLLSAADVQNSPSVFNKRPHHLDAAPRPSTQVRRGRHAVIPTVCCAAVTTQISFDSCNIRNNKH